MLPEGQGEGRKKSKLGMTTAQPPSTHREAPWGAAERRQKSSDFILGTALTSAWGQDFKESSVGAYSHPEPFSLPNSSARWGQTPARKALHRDVFVKSGAPCSS